jgi:XTP/dITP diphosphohydrolase
MGALTHRSLVEYLLEESFEVAETIETGADDAELQGELGDVLLQVVLHARLAQERGSFTFDEVAAGLTAKMVRRNPHVFRPDGSLQDSFPATVVEIVQKWDAVKKAERPERKGPFEGIPHALPALAKAQKALDRAARAGSSTESVASPAAETFETEEQLGDLLLAVVGTARSKGFDAERALRGSVRRYQAAYEGSTTPS